MGFIWTAHLIRRWMLEHRGSRPGDYSARRAPGSEVYLMTLASVPAPAKKSTDPKKRTDSKVVRVQRVRMWITLAQAPPSETNIHGFLSIYDSKPFF